jgi:hypothetical protein
VNPPKGKTISQKVFIEEAQKAAETMPVEEAIAKAKQEAYGHDDTRLSPAMRSELGLESEETKKLFETLAIQLATGTHPLQERARAAGDLKAEIDATKMGFTALKEQFIVKKEHHTVVDEDFENRSTHELEHFRRHGEWPKTLNGDGNSGPETVN